MGCMKKIQHTVFSEHEISFSHRPRKVEIDWTTCNRDSSNTASATRLTVWSLRWNNVFLKVRLFPTLSLHQPDSTIGKIKLPFWVHVVAVLPQLLFISAFQWSWPIISLSFCCRCSRHVENVTSLIGNLKNIITTDNSWFHCRCLEFNYSRCVPSSL